MTNLKKLSSICAAALLLLTLAASCATVKKIFGTENPATASVLMRDGTNNLRALVRYDGKRLLVISDGSLEAEMFLKDSGTPLLGPEKVNANVVLYKVKGQKEWRGVWPTLIPADALQLFRSEAEAGALGIAFIQPLP